MDGGTDRRVGRKVAENFKVIANHIENRQKIPSATGLLGFGEQHLPAG